jgi:hypothetical protein
MLTWRQLADFAAKVPPECANDFVPVDWWTPNFLPPARLWLTAAKIEDGEPVLVVKQEGV